MRNLKPLPGSRRRGSSAPHESRVGRFARLVGTSVLVAVLGVLMVGQPAQAHGQSSAEGYVIVQQALSYLVIEPDTMGASKALPKIEELLAAEDQDGVDVSKVNEAKVALTSGDVAAGRALLQDSITEAVTALKPAVGEETGTTTVVGPYPPQGALTLFDWVILALSVIVLAAGFALAAALRPRESLRELSHDISDAQALRHESSVGTSMGRK
jgi:hypothetical protein